MKTSTQPLFRVNGNKFAKDSITGLMGLAGSVCVLNGHKPKTKQTTHTSAQDLERHVRNRFLTVDGNKFAKDSNSNK